MFKISIITGTFSLRWAVILRLVFFSLLFYPAQVRASENSAGHSGKPSNGLIAFAEAPVSQPSSEAIQSAHIYTVTPDGRNRRQVTQGPAGNFLPAWSPDGKRLAFVSVRNQPPEIWTVDPDGKNERRITWGLIPAWSPDGKMLAFVRPEAEGRTQIWTIRVDGTQERKLTTKGFNNVPSWSPQGDKICYWSGDHRGFGQIWVMNSDGTQPSQLTRAEKNGYTPRGSSANAAAWLFNDRIVYWAGIEHRYGQIWAMNSDGSDQRELTHEPAPASSDNPTWSPDGKKILFDTQRRNRPEVWVMDADGSNPHVVLSDLKVMPMRTSWQPIYAPEGGSGTTGPVRQVKARR